MPRHEPSLIAFFDVDETLITVTSMIGFLAFHPEREAAGSSDFDRARADLLARRERGVAREELNRAYYRLFAGCTQESLTAAGRAWFRQETAKGGLLHRPTLAALHRHRRDGHRIALVSGAPRHCLEPLAEALGGALVLCAGQRSAGGVVTGEIDAPVIGVEKAVRASRAMRAYGADAGDCFAYGDHSSDLPLLCAVGHPVVVGDDPVLLARAGREGWPVLPGVRRAGDTVGAGSVGDAGSAVGPVRLPRAG
ncbi:HAD-IB family hydrolase [Streptomyces sp. NBC_01298]|uniref:HAD family hydrolase n=1 Tax=Streptomyces sp. NBC_01298 TaxID=2903817 RepID=UPI002E0E8307|nr:HAD-IB family hydrolase [Streptomyces sp. NBC_01298]